MRWAEETSPWPIVNALVRAVVARGKGGESAYSQLGDTPA